MCHQHISEHATVYIHRRHAGSNTRGCTPTGAEGIHNSGMAHKKEEVEHSMRQYLPIRNELAIIDCIAMKGKRIINPFQLQK